MFAFHVFFFKYPATITSEMLFSCFFDEPMLNIVRVCFHFEQLWVSFVCFFLNFICCIVIRYALCVGCYLILITDV